MLFGLCTFVSSSHCMCLQTSPLPDVASEGAAADAEQAVINTFARGLTLVTDWPLEQMLQGAS